MKEKTKFYKSEAVKDFNCMKVNNTKWNKQTPLQRAQAIKAKFAFYTNKWTIYYDDADTSTQAEICLSMLNMIIKEFDILKSLIYV